MREWAELLKGTTWLSGMVCEREKERERGRKYNSSQFFKEDHYGQSFTGVTDGG